MNPYLAGIIVGDGHIEKNGRVVIASSNKDFIENIKDLIKFKTSIFYDKSANVWKVSSNSKEFLEEMEKIGVKRGNKTTENMYIKLNKNEMCLFVSGLYDAEGHFEINEKYYKIRIKMKNESIMELVYNFLIGNGYEPRICRKDGCIAVDINKQKNVIKFISNFILLHPKWRRLENLLSGAEGLNLQGYTRPTMRRTMGCNAVRRSQSPKPMPSSDRGLQLAPVKPESLVSEGHQCCEFLDDYLAS